MKYPTFAARLKFLLEANNLERQFLVELCQCNRVSVLQWLRGENIPRLDKLLAICRWFEVSLDWLLREDITIPFPAKESA